MNENEQSKSAAATPPAAPPRKLTGADLTTVQWIPMELLHRSPYQVRREGDVSELAADIQAHGLINPISVRKRAQGDGFEVVAGHRRWAAMRSVDAEAEVPCIVLDVDDRTAEELLVAENFVRADLSIMEQAETVSLLTEHGRTAEECGKVCRRSVRWAHRMRAIGGIGEPWRGFFHVTGLPYADALAVARLPEALREEAWAGLWCDVAGDLRDDEEGATGRSLAAELRGADVATIRARLLGVQEARSTADEALRDSLATEAGLRTFLHDSPETGPRFEAGSFDGPIGRAMSRLRVLRDAPFDTAACASCQHRSDAAPDLWCEDDGRAMPPRCLEAGCWRKCCAKHAQHVVQAAALAGVSTKPIRSSESCYTDRDTLEEAVAEAGGDRGRVTPVVRVDPATGEPTGRVMWRVAPKPAEAGKASAAPPPKREPWEEWRPENPHWTPTLFGDKLARAWLHVGLLLGAASSQFLADEKLGDVTDDVAALLVRCDLLDRAMFEHEVILKRVGQLITPTERKVVAAAWEVYAEARKHLPTEAGDE